MKDVRLYDLLLKSGVPEAALARTFDFLDMNSAKSFPVHLADKSFTTALTNQHYAVIIDFSRPSNQRRLYFMDLTNGHVDKYYVAHGLNTGEAAAERFSNRLNSKESSLGFYLTGSVYKGSHGLSLLLYGLEASNNNAFERNVLHGAKYVSLDFLAKYGRMGRSWGCPAVSMDISRKLIPLLKDGALIYAYHKNLMVMTGTSPTVQQVSRDQQKAPENSDPVVPEEATP